MALTPSLTCARAASTAELAPIVAALVAVEMVLTLSHAMSQACARTQSAALLAPSLRRCTSFFGAFLGIRTPTQLS
eukprot:4135017-Prymnesium_polylepis.2